MRTMIEWSQQPSRIIIGIVTATTILAIALFAYVGTDTIDTIQIHGPLYQKIIEGRDIMLDVFPPPAYLLESYYIPLRLLGTTDITTRDALIKQFFQLEDEYLARRAHWQSRLREGPLKEAIVQQAAGPALEFFVLWHRDFLPAIQDGDLKKAAQTAYGPMKIAFEAHRRGVLNLVQLAKSQNTLVELQASEMLTFRIRLLGTLGIALVGLIFSAAWIINRRLTITLITGLKDQAQQIQATVDTALDAVVVTDADGRIIEWNKQAEQTFGWSRTDVLQRQLAETIIPPSHRESWDTHHLRTNQASNLRQRIELKAVHRDGKEILIELALTPMILSQGLFFSTFIRDITAQKQAEKDLHQSTTFLAFLDSVIDNLPSMVFVKEAETLRYTRFNKAGEKLCGISQEEMLGKDDFEFFSREDAERFQNDDRKALVSGQLLDIPEEIVPTKYRGKRIVHTKKVPLYHANGMPQCVLGISEDVTDYRRTERIKHVLYAVTTVLEESQTMEQAMPRLLQTIAETFQWCVGIAWVWNVEQQVLMAHTTWTDQSPDHEAFATRSRRMRFAPGVGFAGKVCASLQTQWMENILADPDLPRYQASLQAKLKSVYGLPILGDPKIWGVLEFFSPHVDVKDDSLLQCLTAIGTAIGGFLDRLSRFKAQQQAAALARQNRLILYSVGEGLCGITSEGVVSFINPAGAALLGYTTEELVGMSWHAVIHRSTESGTPCSPETCPLHRAMRQGEPYQTSDDLFSRKEASSIPVEYTSTPMYSDTDELKGAVITFRDITERNAVKAKLEQAAQAKSDFLASMSHEIRTPMNSIVAMADLLQETPLSTVQREYVGRFSRAATTLLDLINDILDISKIEAGHIELESVAFDIHDLVDKIAELMAVGAQAKQLELAAFVHPDVPTWLQGDPLRLQQVLCNLVSNAIKFTDHGGVILRIEPDSAAPGVLHCSVSDTGIGIPKDKLESIFESFTQVDSSTTRKYGGTGLGLSISRRLVELMGGAIRVTSTAGHGSTFSLTLPVTETSPPALPSAFPALDLQQRRLLLVDDSEANRMIIREYLKPFGAELVEVADAPAALDALDAASRNGTPFDLAIVDYHMPKMTGLDLAQAIRKRHDGTSLALVLYASDMLRQISERARALRIVAFIYKPVSRKRLLEALRLALHHEQTPLTPDQSNSPSQPCALPPSRILLVEDLEDNRDVIALLLKETPYRLDMAENGAVAVEKFKLSTYDIVLMDMQMPVMDGLQATMEIRQWEREHRRRPTPIVALTANAFKEETDKSLAVGCTAHVTKPIKKETLLTTIARYTTPPASQAA
ncbi:MAG: PAS domain S-box protein [Nitrospira sp.]|nr:PAS domain S-box protein [Nitrospira sp.]